MKFGNHPGADWLKEAVIDIPISPVWVADLTPQLFATETVNGHFDYVCICVAESDPSPIYIATTPTESSRSLGEFFAISDGQPQSVTHLAGAEQQTAAGVETELEWTLKFESSTHSVAVQSRGVLLGAQLDLDNRSITIVQQVVNASKSIELYSLNEDDVAEAIDRWRSSLT